MVRDGRLELPTSCSQSKCATNCANPGFLVIQFCTRCGQTCGQAVFLTTLACGGNACIAGVSMDCEDSVFRLEGGATRSQTRRDTNFAIPGYSISAIIPRRGRKSKIFLSVVIYVVKGDFVPLSAIGENPANAGVARLCGVSPCPVPDTATALPKLCAATLLTIPAFYAFCKRGKRCGWVEFVGQQYILNKSITQDMACRQSNEVRGEIRREPCQPEI